jgi:hypothetical protein
MKKVKTQLRQTTYRLPCQTKEDVVTKIWGAGDAKYGVINKKIGYRMLGGIETSWLISKTD